ncbi:hypothetical protein EYF80_028860 [Liparis tanakae]|uniref:Uncharacterized protein n=1 Tax=Liparis tanakae TaxID=230148 RepID=A0A4Z2H6I8_9TELE|nr:hypothetical protein EYF80_028860 [Liparis tanakae]
MATLCVVVPGGVTRISHFSGNTGSQRSASGAERSPGECSHTALEVCVSKIWQDIVEALML